MRFLHTSLFTLTLATALPTFAAAPPVDLLGDPAPSTAATRTITLTPETRHVNVTGGDIVTFVAGGKSFTWNFDGPQTLSSFPLNRVAPSGLLNRQVMAYIAPNPYYLGGGDQHSN